MLYFSINIVWRAETVINKASLLYDSAQILKLPVVISEHYPKAFGRTIPQVIEGSRKNELNLSSQESSSSVSERTDSHYLFEKKKFSMITEPLEIPPRLESVMSNYSLT
jgi:hypothetical protein